jgi:hypothetical protein
MMTMREAQIGNSGQIVSGHYHSGTECQYGIEPQPLSRYPHLRFLTLMYERFSSRKLVSNEIGFPRIRSNRQTASVWQPWPKCTGRDSQVHLGLLCRPMGEDENETE